MAFAVSLKIGVQLSHSPVKYLLEPRQIRRICHWRRIFKGRCYPMESQTVSQTIFSRTMARVKATERELLQTARDLNLICRKTRCVRSAEHICH